MAICFTRMRIKEEGKKYEKRGKIFVCSSHSPLGLKDIPYCVIILGHLLSSRVLKLLSALKHDSTIRLFWEAVLRVKRNILN